MDTQRRLAFEKKLQEVHQFPAEYPLTCVIPKEEEEEARRIVNSREEVVMSIRKKTSSKGRYISLTFVLKAQNSASVMMVYDDLSAVKKILFI